MASRPHISGVGIGGVGCPPGAQFGGVRRQQSPHGQRQQQRPHHPRGAGGKGGKPDPWLAGTAPPPTTALAMSTDEARRDKLSFGCPHLDGAFEGGVRVQGITEIAGEAGAGKTQLCLQLLLQAQLSPDEGGLGGKSYVLTCGEGDFPSRRLRQMATSFQRRHGVRAEKLMEGVCVQNAKNLDDQMMIIMEHLPIIMRSNNVKLVVIDSIAALFRSDLGRGRSDIGERSRLLGQLSQQMKRLSDRLGAAFVVVNQVTAKLGSSSGGAGEGFGGAGRDGGGNVPAMGLLWSQCINARFMVRRRDFRLSLQPSSNAYPRDDQVSPPIAGSSGNGQENPPPPHSTFDDDSSGSGGGGCGGRQLGARGVGPGVGGTGVGVGSTIAREITLQMSPCVPVHASCGFVIEREGVRGVGR
eukprot:g3141.t1